MMSYQVKWCTTPRQLLASSLPQGAEGAGSSAQHATQLGGLPTHRLQPHSHALIPIQPHPRPLPSHAPEPAHPPCSRLDDVGDLWEPDTEDPTADRECTSPFHLAPYQVRQACTASFALLKSVAMLCLCDSTGSSGLRFSGHGMML